MGLSNRQAAIGPATRGRQRMISARKAQQGILAAVVALLGGLSPAQAGSSEVFGADIGGTNATVGHVTRDQEGVFRLVRAATEPLKDRTPEGVAGTVARKLQKEFNVRDLSKAVVGVSIGGFVQGDVMLNATNLPWQANVRFGAVLAKQFGAPRAIPFLNDGFAAVRPEFEKQVIIDGKRVEGAVAGEKGTVQVVVPGTGLLSVAAKLHPGGTLELIAWEGGHVLVDGVGTELSALTEYFTTNLAPQKRLTPTKRLACGCGSPSGECLELYTAGPAVDRIARALAHMYPRTGFAQDVQAAYTKNQDSRVRSGDLERLIAKHTKSATEVERTVAKRAQAALRQMGTLLGRHMAKAADLRPGDYVAHVLGGHVIGKSPTYREAILSSIGHSAQSTAHGGMTLGANGRVPLPVRFSKISLARTGAPQLLGAAIHGHSLSRGRP